MAVKRERLVRELREFIAALDRRVPRVERAGERAIASDAATLRSKAEKRLRELETEADGKSSDGRSEALQQT